jgi:chondroitin 4-sulfotransferase 11
MSAVILKGQHNINFVHIPKSAGSSISVWLKNNKGNSDCIEFHHIHPHADYLNEQSKNFTFAVVRNPWDRAVSAYEYIKFKTPVAPKLFEEFHKNYRKITEMAEFDFKIFVKHMDQLKIKEEFWWNLSTCQTEWIKQSTDLVLKTENLQFEFDIIKNMLSINSDLLHINSTSHEHYQQYFDEETKSIIAKAFEADVETYKYKF